METCCVFNNSSVSLPCFVMNIMYVKLERMKGEREESRRILQSPLLWTVFIEEYKPSFVLAVSCK